MRYEYELLHQGEEAIRAQALPVHPWILLSPQFNLTAGQQLTELMGYNIPKTNKTYAAIKSQAEILQVQKYILLSPQYNILPGQQSYNYIIRNQFRSELYEVNQTLLGLGVPS